MTEQKAIHVAEIDLSKQNSAFNLTQTKEVDGSFYCVYNNTNYGEVCSFA